MLIDESLKASALRGEAPATQVILLAESNEFLCRIAIALEKLAGFVDMSKDDKDPGRESGEVAGCYNHEEAEAIASTLSEVLPAGDAEASDSQTEKPPVAEQVAEVVPDAPAPKPDAPAPKRGRKAEPPVAEAE